MELRTVQVAGRTIAYRRAGDGPPLVLLHSACSDSREWRLQLADLADEYSVIAWDAPGCGKSWDPPESFRLPDYADTLAGLVEELDLESPHVLGLSFGGGLALEFYRRYPGVPRSLVLASAYAGWAGSLPGDVVAMRLKRVLEDASRPPSEWVSTYLPEFFTGRVPQSLVDEMTAIMLDVRPEGIRPMATAFAEADLRDVLPQVSVPTLLLYGGADVRAPSEVATALHDHIPNSELVVIPGVGHVSQMEAPEVFTSEVRRFLRTVP